MFATRNFFFFLGCFIYKFHYTFTNYLSRVVITKGDIRLFFFLQFYEYDFITSHVPRALAINVHFHFWACKEAPTLLYFVILASLSKPFSNMLGVFFLVFSYETTSFLLLQSLAMCPKLSHKKHSMS